MKEIKQGEDKKGERDGNMKTKTQARLGQLDSIQHIYYIYIMK